MFLGLLPALIVGALALRINWRAGVIAAVAVQVVWVLVVRFRTRGAIDQVLRSVGGRALSVVSIPSWTISFMGLVLQAGSGNPTCSCLRFRQ